MNKISFEIFEYFYILHSYEFESEYTICVGLSQRLQGTTGGQEGAERGVGARSDPQDERLRGDHHVRLRCLAEGSI